MSDISDKLKTIKVLFRTPDSFTLWGIPYDMCEGQQPRDLWKAHRDYVPPCPGWYGSKQIDLSDWVYLGEPGWFGSMTEAEVTAVKDFLTAHKDEVPGNPYEWCRLDGGKR